MREKETDSHIKREKIAEKERDCQRERKIERQ